MIKLFKTISFCAISLEINQWNVHCFTPVFSRTSDIVLWSTITFVQSQLAFILGSADIPSCPQKQCVAFVLITFSCELSLYEYYYFKPN